MTYNVNDHLRLNARVTFLDGQIAENVYDVRILVSGSDSAVEDACVEYLEEMYTEIQSAQSTELDALDIQLRNVTQNTPTKTLEWDTYVGGTDGTASALPPGVAALVTGVTAIAKVVARKYLPGLTVAKWTGAAWSSAVLLALADFALAWIGDFTAGGSAVELRPVVKRSGTSTTTVIGETLVRSEPAYQRRRREGVGD